jgi:hypothetical protein
MDVTQPAGDVMSNLPQALAKFQSLHHSAKRGGKGNYGQYVTLADAIQAVQPATEYGLSHTQLMTYLGDGLMALRTVLMHESGEQLTSDLPLPIRFENGRGNAMQQLGSALTYARRYGLLSIYGLAGDEDDDAESTFTEKKANRDANDFI